MLGQEKMNGDNTTRDNETQDWVVLTNRHGADNGISIKCGNKECQFVHILSHYRWCNIVCHRCDYEILNPLHDCHGKEECDFRSAPRDAPRIYKEQTWLSISWSFTIYFMVASSPGRTQWRHRRCLTKWGCFTMWMPWTWWSYECSWGSYPCHSLLFIHKSCGWRHVMVRRITSYIVIIVVFFGFRGNVSGFEFIFGTIHFLLVEYN